MTTSPWRYGVGMFGTSIPINLIKGSMFYFYVTLLGMPATTFAAVYAVYGVLDAIDNPVFGYLSDRTRTRWGRRRPYLVIGALVLLASMIALFLVPGRVAAGTASLVIWFTLFAILSEMADSLINANYGALLPELFPEEKRRAVANSARQGFQLAAMIIALGLTPMLAQNVLGCTGPDCADPTVGYSRLAVIYGLIATVVIVYMALGVRENPAIDQEERPKFFRSIGQILANRYFWTVGVVSALYGTAMALLLGGLQNYVKYTLGGDGVTATILQVTVIVATMLFLMGWTQIVKRKGAAWTWKWALLVAALGFVPLFFAHNLVTAIAGGLTVALGYAGMLSTNDLILARVLDDDAARHGVHREGTFLSAFGVLTRLNGLVVALALASLTWFFGFESGENPGAQPDVAFRVYLSVYPFVLFLTGAVLSRFITVPGAGRPR
ncbi:MFS transporter [Tessaracoccus caeni]|uniref:MFS transporter n=1 Tax=Tessaracoccus caeni TaxID=3031239 RepID=UPI0023D9B5E3|nr:MFS transporter [Tessaracoccus caeni]MDF1488662.1 MFS transporter [Tessaracoccus caeni]